MIKDEVLDKYVNLAQSENTDKPFDLYQIMADKVIKIIEELPIKDNIGYLNRNFVKTGIKTIPSGATIKGFRFI